MFGQLSSLLVLSSIHVSSLSLSIPIFCFLYFSYFIYLSINFSFHSFLLFLTYVLLCLPVLHMVVVSLSQAILPRSSTELLGFLPPSLTLY